MSRGFILFVLLVLLAAGLGYWVYDSNRTPAFVPNCKTLIEVDAVVARFKSEFNDLPAPVSSMTLTSIEVVDLDEAARTCSCRGILNIKFSDGYSRDYKVVYDSKPLASNPDRQLEVTSRIVD